MDGLAVSNVRTPGQTPVPPERHQTYVMLRAEPKLSNWRERVLSHWQLKIVNQASVNLTTIHLHSKLHRMFACLPTLGREGALPHPSL
jgi:hypothetical protein